MEKEENIYIQQIDKTGEVRILCNCANFKGNFFRRPDFIEHSNFEIVHFTKINEAVLFFDTIKMDKEKECKNDNYDCEYNDYKYEIVHEVKTVDIRLLSN